jgi:hypothetical protein
MVAFVERDKFFPLVQELDAMGIINTKGESVR